VELDRNSTIGILREHAELLGGKLPVRDGDLREAGKLLGWLRNAAGSPDAARLVLSDRIIEQVCGWGGIGDVGRFSREHLTPAWVYFRIRQEIGLAVVGVVGALRVFDQAAHAQLCANESLGYAPGGTLELSGALREIDWLIALAPAEIVPRRRGMPWGRSYRCQVRLRVIPEPGLPHMIATAWRGAGGLVLARSARRELKTSCAM
jgi:hypothetical protein